MATRKQRISFAIKRFKGFWNQFKKSKRGLMGLAIIIFFSIIATFAPLIAPYKPIEPVIPRDEYPGIPSLGIKIAHQLCKPFWYKYLPWIRRGIDEITESFYFYGYFQSGMPFIHFIHENIFSPEIELEKIQATSNYMNVSRKISELKEIKVVLPDGTQQISSIAEWRLRGTREIESTVNPRSLIQLYPNYTKFEVTYTSGVDLVENMKIVKDHKFTTSRSFSEEWTWYSNKMNLENVINVEYDDEHGYVSGKSEDRGCITVTYNAAEDTIPSEDVNVTILREFTYPYYESPQDLFMHAMVNNTGPSPVKVQFMLIREDKKFILAGKEINNSRRYESFYLMAVNKTTLDSIFAAPKTYKFALLITIPAGGNTTIIHLDYVDCLLYGNIFGWLGTDNLKPFPSDIFSTLVYGSRVSLIVGLLTAIFSTIIGLFLGLISGYVGGIVDEGIMRFTDLLMVLPTLPLFIVLTVSMRTVSGYMSMWNIIIILTLFGWMGFARSVRSMVLSLRERAFVEAAKAAGAGRFHIINRHILPNVMALVYVTLAMSVPSAIVVEASLSWLGLGDPRLASWGKILYDFNSSGVVTTKGLLDYWFWVFPACVSIALLAAAFVLVGYALDEILNPKLRERR